MGILRQLQKKWLKFKANMLYDSDYFAFVFSMFLTSLIMVSISIMIVFFIRSDFVDKKECRILLNNLERCIKENNETYEVTFSDWGIPPNCDVILMDYSHKNCCRWNK